jgi:N-acetylmuramoyl-L-alanine amidase
MKKIPTVCLVVGHCKSKAGAVNAKSKVNEFGWNSLLADEIEKVLNRNGKVQCVRVWRPETNSITALVRAVNATKADCYVELHLNASASGTATGTEMLHWHTSARSKALAQLLQDGTVAVLKLRNRGLRSITSGKNGAGQLRKSNMPAVITEAFFIDNDADLKRGTDVMDALAEAQAEAIERFLIQ